MRKLHIILLTFCLCLCLQAQTVKDLQKEQQKLQQELAQTGEMLKQTKKSETATLNKLTLLNQDIRTRKRLIRNINSELTALNNEMGVLGDKRNLLQQELERYKADYAMLVRQTHYADMMSSPLLFLLSSENFQQLLRRMRYMSEFAQYRKLQVKRIADTQAEIDIQNQLLQDRKNDRETALKSQKREQEALARDERKQKSMLNELKKKEKSLKNKQQQQQKRVNELNKKIEQLISQQVRSKTTLTKEQQLIAGGFEANQGRLPWPVEKGFISGYFGTHKHPIYEHVTINNKGIYIQTVQGSVARAVYEGEVTSCIVLGKTYAVIVQHGNYRSVYSNLKELFVKQGDKVQAKQKLGTIFTETEEDNKTELYFQIYKDRNLQNPTLWLAQ